MDRLVEYPHTIIFRCNGEHNKLIEDHMHDCGMTKTEVMRYLLDFYLYYNNTNVSGIACSGCGAIDADKITLSMIKDYK